MYEQLQTIITKEYYNQKDDDAKELSKRLLELVPVSKQLYEDIKEYGEVSLTYVLDEIDTSKITDCSIESSCVQDNPGGYQNRYTIIKDKENYFSFEVGNW